HLGIIGECNIQYALNPETGDYRIIEVNARLSRSSALASKATGYPLAFVAAKLALGYSLTEIQNSITRKTMACFEPALDYLVVKIPRWDLKKFVRVSKRIGSEMKSVGEVMAIGRTFEEAVQKAARMLQIGVYGIVCNRNNFSFGDIEEEIRNPTDERVFAIAEAIKKGISVERIHELSHIDNWFLEKIRNIVETEQELRSFNAGSVPRELLLRAKKAGFSDRQISLVFGMEELDIRKLRKSMGIEPVVKQIDTLAAEYPAETNYLYMTYNGAESDVSFGGGKRVMVLGSGSYSIGSSVEFDWCGVNTVLSLRNMGYETIMVNYNPETVSTDYDICDRLYFDELSFENVLDIYEKEKPMGVVVSMGGQIPNNIALKCHNAGVRVLGTSPESIDTAENRYKFSKLLDELGIEQPEWKELTSVSDAIAFAEKVGYPVLVRPSYVLSGSAMSVALNKDEMESYLNKASVVNPEHPVVISKFIVNAKEIELDAVAEHGKIIAHVIIEHVENAGVHSGDATMVLPSQRIYTETARKIKHAGDRIARALDITGPFNMQVIAKDNRIKVIECNLRASRSFPFTSKVTRVNFVDRAVKAMMGGENGEFSYDINYVGVKAPQFSFSRLKGADPVLGVEMASTGEVACLGRDVHEALLKALISTGYTIPKKNVLVSMGGDRNKARFLDSARRLQQLGFNIFATEGTSKFLVANGISNTMLF
ncbi:MAG: carbamoyl-phosphate synthase large subunit, partial [Candidatus Aenigmarchaeota archaeon]|nr:carbamoyl-phosphate synthase large subunit [Candidatus Aenigmarchaeota archaeon]